MTCTSSCSAFASRSNFKSFQGREKSFCRPFCFKLCGREAKTLEASIRRDLHTLAGMLKKASGRCANTNPTDTARYTRSHMLRGFYLHHVYAPARCQPDGGPLFYLHPGRSPESQAKERQQRQDDERRQALNAKIPPMPGGKGGMKFRCLGHIFRTHFKPILGTFGTFCIHNNILFHIVILQSLRLITGRSQVRPLQGPPDISGTYRYAVSASSFGHIFLDTYSIGGKLSIACLFCLSKTYW